MSDTEDRSVHSRSGSSSKSVSPAKHRSDQMNSKRSSSPKTKSKRSKVSKSRSRTPRKRKHSKRESQSRSRSRSYSRSRSRDRRISYEDGKSGRKDYSRSRYRRSPSRSPSSRRRHYKGDRDNPKESRCVGVFGMSLHTDERTVREVFERYGPLEEVQIVYDYHTGRSRGFAFVYYKYVEDAVEAKENAPGTEIDGHKIRVDFSITERAHTPTPGTYMGSKGGRSFKNYGGRYRRSPSPYKRGGRYRSHSRSVSRGRY